MIIVNDEQTYNDLISMRAHGWSRHRTDEKEWLKENGHLDERFVFLTTGYNLRPTEFKGRLVAYSWKDFLIFVEGRRALATRVRRFLSTNAPWLTLVGSDVLGRDDGIFHSFMCLPFILEADAPIDKDAFVSFLRHMALRLVRSLQVISSNILRLDIYLTKTKDPVCRPTKYWNGDL